MLKENLARIALRSNIEKCIEANPRQQEHPLPPAVLANAVKALVCACWKDSGKFPVARHVLERLLVHCDVVPAAFQQAVRTSGQSDLQGVHRTLFPNVGSTLDTEDRRSTSTTEPNFFGFPVLELDVNRPNVRTSEEWMDTGDWDLDSFLATLNSPSTQPQSAAPASSPNETVDPTGSTSNNPVAIQAFLRNGAALKRPVQSEGSRSKKRQVSSSGHATARNANDSQREQYWFENYVQDEIEKCVDNHSTSCEHRLFLDSAEHIISISQLGHQADTARVSITFRPVAQPYSVFKTC